MRFYCHCLNLYIDVLEVNDDHQTIKQLIPVEVVQIINTQQEWLLCEVPSNQSIHITWKNLCQSIPVREMKLNCCLGCQMYTHITNIASSQMLINKNLFDEKAYENIYHSEKYSKIAKLVLPNTVNSIGTTSLSNSQDENIQNECESVQLACRKAIEDLEKETADNIRIYQREQDEQLTQKTQQLNLEVRMFVSLMGSISRQATITKGSPTLQSSSSYINENSTESGFGSDIFDATATEYGRHSMAIERPLSERNINLDDETNDDPMLDNQAWNDSNSGRNFATSLPQNISSPPPSVFFIPEQGVGNDLESIGRSFRDLSGSLCTDGTELFGDLPLPRHNARHT